MFTIHEKALRCRRGMLISWELNFCGRGIGKNWASVYVDGERDLEIVYTRKNNSVVFA